MEARALAVVVPQTAHSDGRFGRDRIALRLRAQLRSSWSPADSDRRLELRLRTCTHMAQLTRPSSELLGGFVHETHPRGEVCKLVMVFTQSMPSRGRSSWTLPTVTKVDDYMGEDATCGNE